MAMYPSIARGSQANVFKGMAQGASLGNQMRNRNALVDSRVKTNSITNKRNTQLIDDEKRIKRYEIIRAAQEINDPEKKRLMLKDNEGAFVEDDSDRVEFQSMLNSDTATFNDSLDRLFLAVKPPNEMSKYGAVQTLSKNGQNISGQVDQRGNVRELQGYGPEIKKDSPLVNINTGDEELPYKLESGYMLKDPSDPAKGVTPIPGGGKDRALPEQAGKIQMMRTAQKQYNKVKSLVYDKDGTPNWTNISNAWIGTPKTKGRELATSIEFGIQAITRMETGAAMPAEEVKNTRKRFQPVPGDTNETVKIKMQMFDEFVNGTLKLIDPSGRFSEDRFQEEMKVRKSQGIKFMGFE